MTIASDMKDLADDYAVRKNAEADQTILVFYPDLMAQIKNQALQGKYLFRLKDFSYYVKHTKNLSDQLRQDAFLLARLNLMLTTDGFELETIETDFSSNLQYQITWN